MKMDLAWIWTKVWGWGNLFFWYIWPDERQKNDCRWYKVALCFQDL